MRFTHACERRDAASKDLLTQVGFRARHDAVPSATLHDTNERLDQLAVELAAVDPTQLFHGLGL